ncbi:hypothetical protein F9K50_01620 [bacterium]|nr:MAG: hypothetical protein F9K50_01620 [bacterium]
MKEIDLTKIIKEEHQGKWVVYSPSQLKVFSSETDPKKALKEAKDIPCEDKTLLHVLPFDHVFAPCA